MPLAAVAVLDERVGGRLGVQLDGVRMAGAGGEAEQGRKARHWKLN